jgi:transcriptional regulator with XRE-family HTH domain
MTWTEYVKATAGADLQNEIARKMGVDQSTASRWLRGAPAGKPSNVAAFAKAYGRPVLEAFVAAGFLTDDDAHTQVTITRHEDPSDEELLDLLRRRLDRDQRSSDGPQSAPMTEHERVALELLRELGDDVTLGELRATAAGLTQPIPRPGVDVADLDQRRQQATRPVPDVTKHAARRGKLEQTEPGTEQGESLDPDGHDPA